MSEIDFTGTPDVADYSPLPDGEYLCKLQTVRPRETRAGDSMLALEFVVIDGAHAGRKIFDNMLWHTDGTKNRAKHICKELGLDVSGKCAVSKEILEGRKVYVTVEGTRTYQDANGNDRENNIVPFAGYRAANDEPDEDNDLPF